MNDRDVDNNNEEININKILKRTTKGITSILANVILYKGQIYENCSIWIII